MMISRNHYKFSKHSYCTWSTNDTLSRTTKKIFKPDLDKLAKIREKKKNSNDPKPWYRRLESVERKIGSRLNTINMQMLSKTLYNQIFKGYRLPEYRQEIVEQCLRNLHKHDVKTDNLNYMEDVDFALPPLEGNNLEDHFKIIAEEQSQPYVKLLKQLINCKLPKRPNVWHMKQGWTKYKPGKPPERVAFPDEKALIFDVEVCVPIGKAPTMATAVGTKAWYGWVSEQLIQASGNPVTKHQYASKILIPLESDDTTTGINLPSNLLEPKVVVGHNVSYDRSRVKEQYWLERTGLRFVDTMSMHVSISGMTSYQRAVLKSGKMSVDDETWAANSSLNSLKEVYKLYCNSELDKESRTMFLNGSLQDIHDDFQNLMNYCSNDVKATYEVFSEMFPMFLVRFPHPVTFAGMLELSTAYLPVNSNWDRYITDSEQTFDDLDVESTYLLSRRADQACQLLENERFKNDIWLWDQDWDVKHLKMLKAASKSDKTKTDLSKKKGKETITSKKLETITSNEIKDDLSNNIGKEAITAVDEEDTLLATLTKRFAHLTRLGAFVRSTLLPGYPSWYRKLCVKPSLSPNWTPGVNNISTSMQITPKLLSLTWEGFPLHYIRGKGWGFLVPFSRNFEGKTIPLQALLDKCPLVTAKPDTSDGKSINISNEVQDNLSRKEYYSRVKSDETDGAYKGTGIWCDTTLEECVFFMRLPHKDGASHRVGNPLAKDFLNKFSENVLAGDTASAEHVLDIARQLSYWRNNRDRIRDQMVVWLDQLDLPEHLRDRDDVFGAILPQVVVAGTLTRRAVEPTWMTASNAHEQRIGSELRAMIQAPPGYSIVGADVDSQELWIASVIGDASCAKMHGATPLGWMTLSGTKSDGTDMHSVTAKAVGISRDHAKVINYARIYGAGQNFAERLLKQFNPSMSATDARRKAVKMFEITKGKRVYRLKDEFLDALPDKVYNKWQAHELAKVHNKPVHNMFHNAHWVGGSESAMFNRLEEIASSAQPVTPFLGCRLSRALEPEVDVTGTSADRFLPTRVNWVVQSGAVDFLHLMLVCMRWLMEDRARFCLSFHDEVRYLVPDEHKYRAALAMHVTNLLTRAFCSLRLGIADLPQSVAFFSSVEVDTVLRKEAKSDCKTPSNPHGLTVGYGIGHGESLDVHEAVMRAGGKKGDWYKGLRV